MLPGIVSPLPSAHCRGGACVTEEAAEAGGGGARCRYNPLPAAAAVAEALPRAGSLLRVAGSTAAAVPRQPHASAASSVSRAHCGGTSTPSSGETIPGNNFSSMSRFSLYCLWKNQRRQRTRCSRLRFIISYIHYIDIYVYYDIIYIKSSRTPAGALGVF